MLSRIHRVELYNFKSYCGRVDVGPFKDFTCIVGPNGAGKSNLMDALSFVLSTADAATLRGRQLTDFISRNAKKQECAVTIVLRQQHPRTQPPQQQTGAAATATAEATSTSDAAAAAATSSDGPFVETAFCRRVDGNGSTTVYVNDKVVTQKQFTAALEAHRIGSRVNTFLVFQHEVAAVAQKKAKQLTELLEQVSGSGELKAEYSAKKAAMEEANEALAAASLEKREAAVAANQMRLAKKEAEKYDELASKRAQEKRDIALMELFFIETELQKQKTELDRFNEKLADLEKSIASEDAIRAMKRDYAERHKVYLEDLKQNRKTAEDLRNKLTAVERVKATLAHLARKHALQKAELETLQKADAVRSKEAQRLEAQRKKQVAVLAGYDRECEDEDRENDSMRAALGNEQLEEYRQLRKEADCATVTHRQHQETVRRQRDSIKEALRQCELVKELQERDRKDLQSIIDRTTAQGKELEQRRADLEETCATLEKQIAKAQVDLFQAQKRSKERESELAKVQEQLHELRYMKDTDRQNSRAAETLQAMRALLPVRGRLVDLCTIPNDRHRNAVTVALGKNLEAIVVNTMEVALSCVRYLKEQRLPPMTFLPLDSVQGKAVDDRLRTFGGTCKPIVDVVRYDPELEPVIRFALGQTLLCDGVAEAKKVAYGQASGERFKVVTLDGSLLLKNGSVQGGLASVQSRARKWDEKKYDDLRAARDRLVNDAAGGGEAELARAQIAIRDMTARLEFTKGRVKVVDTELAANASKLAGLQSELTKQAEQASDTATRESRYRKELEEVERELLQASKAISQVEGRIFAEFQKKVNMPNLLQMESRQVQLAKQRAEHRQQLQLLIHKLETALETETKRVGDSRLQDAKELCARLEKEMERSQKDLTVQEAAVAEVTARHEAIKTSVTKARAELDTLEHRIREVARTSETELNRLGHARKGAIGLQVACDTLRMRRLNLVRRCQMEEIDLPLSTSVAGTPAVNGAKRARGENGTGSNGGGGPRARKRLRGGNADDEDGDEEADAGRSLRSESFMLLVDSSPEVSGIGSGQAVAAASTSASAADTEVSTYIDFSGLTTVQRDTAADRARFQAYKQRSEAFVESLTTELETLAPNRKVASKLQACEERLGSSSTALDEARERARKAHSEFLHVKEQRSERFMEAYEKIAASVDRVYQELTLGTRAHGVHGSAYLSLEDAEEPYLGGTTYHATPPLKRFMPMELLSGGERTMAALALLFAIHAVSPTPFFVLDEVDAALDAGNVEKLANYLRKNCNTCQFIVVSLKDQLYYMADLLIGVMKDKERESSGVVTMDLRGYPF